MLEDNRRKKVLCPIERNGKTYWRTMGTAYVNKDNSINVYLDGLPWNGKLQVRDFDEKDEAASRGGGNNGSAPAQFPLRAVSGRGGGAGGDDAGVNQDLPF